MFILTMNFMLINNSFPIQFTESFLVCFFFFSSILSTLNVFPPALVKAEANGGSMKSI